MGRNIGGGDGGEEREQTMIQLDPLVRLNAIKEVRQAMSMRKQTMMTTDSRWDIWVAERTTKGCDNKDNNN